MKYTFTTTTLYQGSGHENKSFTYNGKTCLY